mmetsp:Transcript_39802/g.81889  ORF Transcript_39802/g.81889 Transcript_39802/m.81889 type:complete len:690 (+) Transcript_39802:245-2314(+)
MRLQSFFKFIPKRFYVSSPPGRPTGTNCSLLFSCRSHLYYSCCAQTVNITRLCYSTSRATTNKTTTEMSSAPSAMQDAATDTPEIASTPPEKEKVPEGYELVEEGLARMIYPKAENSVFYNPVQVQNRDLSVLMLSMYAERRAMRKAVKAKKKELVRQAREEGNATKVDETKIQAQLDEYAKSVDWTQHVKKSGTDGGMRVLDALAASGLRSIRYWKEIPGISQVVINDLEDAAVQQAKENVAFNGLEAVLIDNDDDDAKHGIRVQCGDATHVMYTARRPPGLQNHTYPQSQQRDQFDVIDLDPYGSAAPFIDSAVQAVVNGGMLAVTCTDMAALGGSHPETCYGRYGSIPIPRARYLQELALRILLYSLSTAAAKYGRTIRPILSVGMNFYVRVFVEVWDDKAGVIGLSLNHGSVYQSTRCPSFHIVPHGQNAANNRNVYQPARAPPAPSCEETGGTFKVAGPIWLAPLHDYDVVDAAAARLEQPSGGTVHPLHRKTAIHGLLTVVGEELSDTPLYYTLPDLCHTLRCSCPPMNIAKAALINAGYRVSAYHKEPNAIKTDAPNSVIWDVMRAWCKDNPPKKGGKKNKKKQKKREAQKAGNSEGESGPDSAANEPPSISDMILSVEPKIVVDFTIPEELNNKKKAQRFPMNPEKNWGPKPAASGKRKATTADKELQQPPSKTAKASGVE